MALFAAPFVGSPPFWGPPRRSVLDMLVREAYRSIRFYDGSSAASAIKALGDLRQPPPNPKILVRTLIGVMGCFQGIDLPPLLEGLSKLDISHRMLTAHLLKRYLRYLQHLLGDGTDRPGESLETLDWVLTLLTTMVANTQHLHSQRTTRTFLCCVDEYLAPQLARYVEHATGSPTGPAGDGATLVTDSVGAYAKKKLVHRVLYLFEVYRNASLVGADCEQLSPLLLQLMLLVLPHLSPSLCRYLLSVMRPSGLCRRGAGTVSLVDAVCERLLRRMSTGGGAAAGGSAVLALGPGGGGSGPNPRSQGATVAPQSPPDSPGMDPGEFLRLAGNGTLLRLFTAAHGDPEQGVHPWSALLLDALRFSSAGRAPDPSTAGTTSKLSPPRRYLAFLDAITAPESAAAPHQEPLAIRRGWAQADAAVPTAAAYTGRVVIQLGILRLLEQHALTGEDPAPNMCERVETLLGWSSQIWRLVAAHRPAMSGAGPAALYAEELDLLQSSITALHTGDHWRRLASEGPAATPAVDEWLGLMTAYRDETVLRWTALLRQESAWLTLVCGGRPSPGMPLSAAMPATLRAEKRALWSQHQDLALASWSLLATALECPGEGSPTSILLKTSPSETLRELITSLTLTVDDWLLLAGNPRARSLVAALVRAWEATVGHLSDLGAQLLSAGFLPRILDYLVAEMDRTGPYWREWTPPANGHVTSGAAAHHRRVVEPAGPPVPGDLCLRLLQCVVLLSPCSEWQRCAQSETTDLVWAVVKWHPLARQSATSLADWKTLQALWFLDYESQDSDPVDSGAAASAFAGSEFPGMRETTPSLPGHALHAFPLLPEATGRVYDFSGQRHFNPGFLWTQPFHGSVTEALMYGARRTGDWSRSQFEHTLKEMAYPSNLLEYAWQRTREPYHHPSAPLLPTSGGGDEGGQHDLLGTVLRRLLGADEARAVAQPGIAGGCPPVTEAAVQFSVSSEVVRFLGELKRDLSQDGVREMLRLDELLAAAVDDGAESEGGSELVCITHHAPHLGRVASAALEQRQQQQHMYTYHRPSPLILRGRILCSVLVSVFAHSLQHGLTPDDEQLNDSFRTRASLFIQEAQALSRQRHGNPDYSPAEDPRVRQAALAEVRGCAAALVEGLLPDLLLSAVNCQPAHPHEDLAFALHCLTLLSPIPDRLAPVYGRLNAALAGAFSTAPLTATSDPLGAGLAAAGGYVHFEAALRSPGAGTLLFAPATSETVISLCTRFLASERRSRSAPGIDFAGDVFAGHLHTLLRTTSLLVWHIDRVVDGTVVGTAGPECTIAPNSHTQRTLLALMPHLVLLHILATHGPASMDTAGNDTAAVRKYLQTELATLTNKIDAVASEKDADAVYTVIKYILEQI